MLDAGSKLPLLHAVPPYIATSKGNPPGPVIFNIISSAALFAVTEKNVTGDVPELVQIKFEPVDAEIV